MNKFENVQSKGTVISYFPFEIKTQKPELIPNEFTILAGDPLNNKFSINHFDTIPRRAYVGELRGGFEFVVCPASELCESIVNDYFASSILVGFTEDGKRIGPGLTWFGGLLDEKDIQSKYKDEIKELFDSQVTWFKKLVTDADDTWKIARTHRSITDLQRYAANFLKLDREWLTELEIRKTNNICPRCGTVVPLTAAQCFNCEYVLNVELWKQLNIEQDKLKGLVKA